MTIKQPKLNLSFFSAVQHIFWERIRNVLYVPKTCVLTAIKIVHK